MHPNYKFPVCAAGTEDKVIDSNNFERYIVDQTAHSSDTVQMDHRVLSSNASLNAVPTNLSQWHFRTPDLRPNVSRSGTFKFYNPTSNNDTIQMTAPTRSFSTLGSQQQTSANSQQVESDDDTFEDYQVSRRDEIINKLRGIPSTHRKPYKRKIASSDKKKNCKIFVNEDRMAEHMRGLNLDNNNLDWVPNMNDYPLSSRTTDYDDDDDDDDGSENDLSDEACGISDDTWKQLDFSSVVKYSNAFPVPDILPPSITKHIQKQNMQVVLWKSPGDNIREIVQKSSALNKSMSGMNSRDDLSLNSVINPPIFQIPAGENEMKEDNYYEESASNQMES